MTFIEARRYLNLETGLENVMLLADTKVRKHFSFDGSYSDDDPISKMYYIGNGEYLCLFSGFDILNTVLKTPDNKTIIIPNGQVSNAAITNFSTEKERRMDLVFGIGYNDNIDSAKKIILDYIKKDNRILKDPEPFVRTSSLSASSVDITVRAWVKSADYWNVHFDMLEKIKVEFDKKGISIPFPQTDVHLYKHTR